MQRRFVTMVALGLFAGCAPPPGARRAGVAALVSLPLNITGKYASRLSLEFSLDRGAGPQPAKAQLLSLWGALQDEGGATSVSTSWQMCTLPVPGLGEVPTHQLDPV